MAEQLLQHIRRRDEGRRTVVGEDGESRPGWGLPLPRLAVLVAVDLADVPMVRGAGSPGLTMAR